MPSAISSPGRTSLAVAAVLVLAGGAAFALLRPREAPRPDVVLVVWDTCRADRLSGYGGPRPTTPLLDRFAAGGVRFARCITPAPWTAPAHGSLFTGLMPSAHGLRVGRGDVVNPAIPLLAETLARGGYATVGVSANPVVSALHGFARGFDDFTLADTGNASRDAALVLRRTEEALARRDADPAARAKPLFLFLNFMDLHLPHRPPAAAAAAVQAGGDLPEGMARAAALGTDEGMEANLGAFAVDSGTAEALKFLYDADLRHLDAETGRLFEALRARGILDRALVVVTGDHGDLLGEHGLLGHRLSMLEPLLHVPLVVRRPGSFEGGRVVEAPVSLMDLYPTILAAARVPIPPGTGTDARPLEEAGGDPRRVLLAEHGPHVAFLEDTRLSYPSLPESAFEPLRWMFQSARTAAPGDRYKLLRIERLGDDGRFTPVGRALHDLAADPGERRNLLDGEVPPAARAAADLLEEGLAAPTVPGP